jgi:hypothetical protein
VLKWRVHDEKENVRVAVARSEEHFAERPEDVLDPESGQVLLYEGTDDYCQDQAVIGGVTYYYTCFARLEDAAWQREHDFKIKPRVENVYEHHEVFGRDDPRYLKAMDRMRGGLAGGFPGGAP